MTGFAAAWSWFLSTAVGRWIVGIGAVLAGIAALAYVAFRKGKRAQADTDAAKGAEASQRAAQAETKAIQHAAQTRQDVDNAITTLPDAPAQTVATADPATAAGELRTDGWMRDPASPNDH